MGYLIKAILGAALFLGGVALFNIKLVSLLDWGLSVAPRYSYGTLPEAQVPVSSAGESGALTDPEFEREKAKILAE